MQNICIVGYGAVGPVHAAALEGIKNVQLYAVCDIDPQKLSLCRDMYGCKVFSSFDEMLLDANIDAVHICTPHYLHTEMAVKALAAGKAVVLEKPVGISLAEVEALRAVSKEQANIPLCVMLQNRTNACIVKLKEQIACRDVGALRGIIANLNWHRDEAYYKQDPWRGKWQTEGGGLLINQAVHLVDLMLYFGGAVKKYESDIHRWGISEIEVEDTASAIMQFENGAKGVFHATNCYITDEAFQLELRFEKAHFRYADGLLYEILNGDAEVLARDEKLQIGKSYWGCGHQTVIRNFYEGKEYPGIQDAYGAMKFVFEIYDRTKREI